MDLYCRETTENEIEAYEDPTLLEDRILKTLLEVEDKYLVVSSKPVFQKEVTNEMRHKVSDWMMEVCEEQHCQNEVFLLAMNYFNRFLLLCCIKKNQLQLLGTTCMLIASKLRQPKPLPVQTLVYYTDFSITEKLLRHWELLVVSKLKWDMAAITPQDFVPHLLKRLSLLKNEKKNIGINAETVNNHAKTLIALCAKEIEFVRYHPSIVACASVASALDGLGWTIKYDSSLEDLIQQLSLITSIEKDYMKTCLIQIEKMIRALSDCNMKVDSPSTCEESIRPEEFSPPLEKMLGCKTVCTPTDVHDIHF